MQRLTVVSAILLAVCVSWTTSARCDDAAAARPNFIFFLTDDQGWQDLHCCGHPYLKTPNFDRLAKEGTRFEQFYVNASVCSPSRTAFMTGQYPARHGVHRHFATQRHHRANNMPDWLNPDAPMVNRMLQKAGYRTGHFGKWHLTSTWMTDAPQPSKYGIDEHRVICGPGPGWDRDGNRTPKDIAQDSYNSASDKDRFWTHSTDLMVDEAIEFIEKHRDKPFYLNLWTILPHAPNRPTAEQLAQYQDVKADAKDFDSWMREYVEQAKNPTEQMQTYCAAMTSVDSALGRLLNKLDELGLADNTLVFFTSDNGPEDYHIGNVANSGLGSPGKFRGRKRSLYEGGVRMPCIARWPGKIPAGQVDRTSVIGGVDWLPTVCSLAGIETADSKPDGEDVSDILQGKSRPRRGPMFWEWRAGVAGNQQYKPPGLAVRDGDWKLFANPDGSSVQLYNIPKDPEERTNLAEKNPEVVARLLPKLLAWKKTLPD